MNDRTTWHKYFMDIAELISKRGTCLSRKVGAVAVKDKRILATGYNGQIIGAKHCETCLRKKNKSGEFLNNCRACHAEENIVAFAAQTGVSLRNCMIYCMIKPCNRCFKLLAQSIVETIIFKDDYDDPIIDLLIEDTSYYQDKFIDTDGIEYNVLTNMDKFLFNFKYKLKNRVE